MNALDFVEKFHKSDLRHLFTEHFNARFIEPKYDLRVDSDFIAMFDNELPSLRDVLDAIITYYKNLGCATTSLSRDNLVVGVLIIGFTVECDYAIIGVVQGYEYNGSDKNILITNALIPS